MFLSFCFFFLLSFLFFNFIYLFIIIIFYAIIEWTRFPLARVRSGSEFRRPERSFQVDFCKPGPALVDNELIQVENKRFTAPN